MWHVQVGRSSHETTFHSPMTAARRSGLLCRPSIALGFSYALVLFFLFFFVSFSSVLAMLLLYDWVTGDARVGRL